MLSMIIQKDIWVGNMQASRIHEIPFVVDIHTYTFSGGLMQAIIDDWLVGWSGFASEHY